MAMAKSYWVYLDFGLIPSPPSTKHLKYLLLCQVLITEDLPPRTKRKLAVTLGQKL